MEIESGNLQCPAVIELLNEHLRGMTEHSPPDGIHALDHSGLAGADISFWTVWDDDELLGCGALKALDARHGEIKSMRTAARHLGKGVARCLLEHILETARNRGYKRISLETGSGPAFDPAHALYAKYGFEYCGPFAGYRDNPFSRFMTREL